MGRSGNFLNGDSVTTVQIRNLHKDIRNRMSPAQVKEKSQMICQRLIHAKWYESCRVIYGYYPLGNEVDCRPFLEQAICNGKTVALPATGRWQTENCRMEFFGIDSLAQVAEGNFHVMEPLWECKRIQADDGVALVPGVVFDGTGNRYGYGGGYYDRYFSRFPHLYRVAVCYENQMETELPTLATDVKMHEILTEKTVYHMARG